MLQELPSTSVAISAVIDAATVGLIVSNIFMYLKIRRKASSNGPKPGTTEQCIKHESSIQVLKSQVENHAGDISHIRKRVDDIYNLILRKGDTWSG